MTVAPDLTWPVGVAPMVGNVAVGDPELLGSGEMEAEMETQDDGDDNEDVEGIGGASTTGVLHVS